MGERSRVHRVSDDTDTSSAAASSQSKHYPTIQSTSSAFSANANPDEDWTKISDLAERRRIQNRIAQRNYRKKLKKRFEDLEKRARADSASPEEQNVGSEQLDTAANEGPPLPNPPLPSAHSNQDCRTTTSRVVRPQYVPPADDRSMFALQSTRQLSTSPSPFSSSLSTPLDGNPYLNYSQSTSYCTFVGNGVDMPLYPHYVPPTQQSYQTNATGMTPSLIKQETYENEEMYPFGFIYPSFAGAEMPLAQSLQDAATYVSNIHHCSTYPPQYPPYHSQGHGHRELPSSMD